MVNAGDNGPPGSPAPGAVTILGLDGLGGAAALALASARAGHLVLADDALVAVGEVDRSVIFSPGDAGASRARAAQRHLAERFPDVQIEVRPLPASAADARGLVEDAGVVLLATGDTSTLLAVHDAAVELRRPCVHTALLQFTVQLLTIQPAETPCLRCLFGDGMPRPASGGVESAGGFAPLSAFGGALAGAEAVRLLRGQPCAYGGRMLIYEARSASGRLLRIARRRDCAVCGRQPVRAEA